jgi:hypothetical protein
MTLPWNPFHDVARHHASQTKLQEMAAVWDMLAIERKLELDEKKPGEPEH